MRIEVNHDCGIGHAIGVLGEWEPHVQEFLANPDFEWLTWCNDRAKMLNLMRAPLARTYADLSPERQMELKQGLQYFLNVDEFVPYHLLEGYRSHKSLISKQGGETEAYFANLQHILHRPADSYALCQWMWEILFNGEDWHTDISNWVVVDTTQTVQLGTPDAASPTPPRSFLAKLFGKT